MLAIAIKRQGDNRETILRMRQALPPAQPVLLANGRDKEAPRALKSHAVDEAVD